MGYDRSTVRSVEHYKWREPHIHEEPCHGTACTMIGRVVFCTVHCTVQDTTAQLQCMLYCSAE